MAGFIPVREIRQGTVQSVMMLRPEAQNILTKAGSFGDDDAIWHMYRINPFGIMAIKHPILTVFALHS